MTNLSVSFLPDVPISSQDDDVLGFKSFVGTVADAVNNTQTPFVYGVLGDWGVGKTSILRLLEEQFQFDAAQDVISVPIWFNAWEYENEAHIIYPLLHTIAASYEEEVVKKDRGELQEDTKAAFFRVASTTMKASAFVLGDLGLRSATNWLLGSPVKLDDVEKRVKEYYEASDSIIENTLGNWVNSVDKLKKDFAALLEAYSQGLRQVHGINEKTKIQYLILIDDLDRCLPDTTISILESIKNHLSVPSVIYVLGLNPEIVYQGIRYKYNGLDINGREYLEKIINYTFYVPELKYELVSEFAINRINLLVPDEVQRQSHEKYFTDFGETVAACRFNNPRKIKRILNRYLFFLSKNSDELDDYDMPNIVRLLIISEHFPAIFELLMRNPHEVQPALRNLVQNTSNLDAFQSEFSVDMTKDMPRMMMMRSLFEHIRNPMDDKPYAIDDHVRAIASITRTI